MCQAPGCLFPMGSDRFDDFVVHLGANGASRNRTGSGRTAKGVGQRPARQGQQGRRAKPDQRRKSTSEPEPFPLSGFYAAQEDDTTQFLGGDDLDDDDALAALLNAAEGSSAESPQMEPANSVGASGAVAISAMSLAAPPSCTTAQLLSDDDEDDEDDEKPLVRCAEQDYTGENTPDATTPSGRVPAGPPSLLPSVGRASPSMVVSNSSYDTAATLVSPPHVPSNEVGKRCALEEELAKAWEDADSEASDAETPLPGDATPTRPTKIRRVEGAGIMIG